MVDNQIAFSSIKYKTLNPVYNETFNFYFIQPQSQNNSPASSPAGLTRLATVNKRKSSNRYVPLQHSCPYITCALCAKGQYVGCLLDLFQTYYHPPPLSLFLKLQLGIKI